MRCPECGYDQKRGQEGMTCKKCGRAFVFDPKGSPRFTDAKFLALVTRLNARGQYAFTANQLYAAYARRTAKLSSPRALFIIGAIIIVASVTFAAFAGAPALFFAVFGALVMIGAFFAGDPPNRKRWDAAVSR